MFAVRYSFLIAIAVLSTGCSNADGAANKTGGAAANTGGKLGVTGGTSSGGGGPGKTGGAGTGGGVGAGGSSANAASGGATNSGGAPGSGGSVATAGSGGVSISSYNPCPAAGSPCVILPFGDSITWGYPHPETGGYRVPLFSLAHQAGKSLTFIGSMMDGPATVDGAPFPANHDGWGGATIADLMGRCAPPHPDCANFQANIVLMHAGTNDIEQGIDSGNFADPQTVATALGGLLDKTIGELPNALIVVALVIPYRTPSHTQQNAAYNALIPGVVAQRQALGKHVVLVDQFAPFVQDVNYGVNLMEPGSEGEDHPNAAGYALMAQVWYQAISPLLR